MYESDSPYGIDFVELPEFYYLLIFLVQYFEYMLLFASIDSSNDKRISLNEFL